jgi:hypothetical protein
MDEFDRIKMKNVIDMAITFTAMNRVFQKESKKTIVQELEAAFHRLATVEDRHSFETIHSDFCDWFVASVRTAPKKLKNNTIKPSRNASYGHAAKIFDIAGKVYVYYCHLPNRETAVTLLPLLHGAVDTPIMKYLKSKFQTDRVLAETIEGITKSEYMAIQGLVAKDIETEFKNLIFPVQYDDFMWSRLNRRNLIGTGGSV